MANAISVRKAARKENKEATRVTVMWWEKDSPNAMKVTAAAVAIVVEFGDISVNR
jgi:hypothetical protein